MGFFFVEGCWLIGLRFVFGAWGRGLGAIARREARATGLGSEAPGSRTRRMVDLVGIGTIGGMRK